MGGGRFRDPTNEFDRCRKTQGSFVCCFQYLKYPYIFGQRVTWYTYSRWVSKVVKYVIVFFSTKVYARFGLPGQLADFYLLPDTKIFVCRDSRAINLSTFSQAAPSIGFKRQKKSMHTMDVFQELTFSSNGKAASRTHDKNKNRNTKKDTGGGERRTKLKLNVFYGDLKAGCRHALRPTPCPPSHPAQPQHQPQHQHQHQHQY